VYLSHDAFYDNGLQAWVHRRCRQAGLPSPAAVHLISSVKGTGVKDVLGSVQEMVGARGDVWVVGAQNAGKSSLINAMQRLAGLKGGQQLTTAAQPGTTLGDCLP
jgi:ribosome biogenesis GTPase A